jgi:hypothetical protein
MLVNAYSLELHVIGTIDQTPTFEPDQRDSLVFHFDNGGDANHVYRCRLTSRKTLACLIDVYREGVELKRIAVTSERIWSCHTPHC